jgi:glycosyltransferase involved in cell wall biosynthesis
MRLAFDVGPIKAQPAGVGIYTRSLAGALSELMPPEDLAFIGKRPDATGLPDIVRASSRPNRVPYPVWAELLGGIDARRVDADVAHFTDGLVPIVRSGPTVVTVHDLSIVRQWRHHPLRRLPRVPLVLASPHLATRVIADSRATANEVMRLAHVSARKIDVVLLAPRPGAAPASPEVLAEVLARHDLVRDRFLLAPGTIEPRKNHVRLVEAFSQLATRREIEDDVVLVIAGGAGWGSKRAIRAIDESAVSRRIRRLGYVTDSDLVALMTGAGAVVYVSTYEGFGLPVLEAMASGAPVVTSAVSSMPEAAGDAAVLVDPFSVASIARGIQEALAGHQELALRSLMRAKAFTWGRTAAATREVYSTAER